MLRGSLAAPFGPICTLFVVNSDAIELLNRVQTDSQPHPPLTHAPMDNLGLKGLGVPPSGQRGLGLVQNAAKAGLPQAQVAQAQVYMNNQHATPDPQQAVLWLRKAANQGYAPAVPLLKQLGVGWRPMAPVAPAAPATPLAQAPAPALAEAPRAAPRAPTPATQPTQQAAAPAPKTVRGKGDLVIRYGKSSGMAFFVSFTLTLLGLLLFSVGGLAGLFAIASLAAAALVWLERSRYEVELYERALVRHSLWGSTTIMLSASTRLYFRSVRQSINFIPVGTYHYITVSDSKSQLSLTPHLTDAVGLRECLQEFEAEHITPQAAQNFQEGKSP